MEFFKNYGNESTDEDSEMSTEEVEDYGNSDNGVLRKGIKISFYVQATSVSKRSVNLS